MLYLGMASPSQLAAPPARSCCPPPPLSWAHICELCASGRQCYIASDASAVVEHTKQVVYLEDNDLVHMVGGAYGIFNVSMQVGKRR